MSGPLLERSGCGFAEIAAAVSTADLKDTMVTFGMIADSGASPLNLDGGKLTCGEAEIDGALNHDGTTAGLYGATPVSQAGAITSLSLSTLSATGFASPGPDLLDITTVAAKVDVDGGFSTQTTNNSSIETAVNAILTALRNIGAIAT